jgi:orotidine-5'-phosphate decarboxylase
MMEAASEALAGSSTRPLLTAVTVLTSMTDEDLAETGITVPAAEQVKRLALLAKDCGVDGVVCSAQEAPLLRDLCGHDFLKVTPGIRPAGSAAGDQRRIVTPPQALQLGVSHMVIGRPITAAASPTQAVADILQSLKSA